MEMSKDKSSRGYTIEDLEEILDKLPYQIWMKDKEGKHIYINKSGAEAVGLKKEEVIGKDDFQIREHTMAEKCVETDKVLMKNNEDIYNEEYVQENGQEIWYKVHKFLLERNKGENNIICGLAEEVSLDKKLKLKLESNILDSLYKDNNKEESKKYIHSVLVSLKKTFNFKNIDILLYNENKKTFNLYISENEEISIFKNNFNLVIDEEIEYKINDNCINCNKYCQLYGKIIEMQKDNIEKNLKLKYIKLADKLFGLICITYDKEEVNISKDEAFLEEIINKISIIVKQIENDEEIKSIIKKKNELEASIELEAIKMDFFAKVSHEFRTPVNVIVSIIQLLNMYIQEEYNTIDKNKFKDYLSILKKNSYRLLKVVDNLIDISKINNNEHKINLENHNIINVVEAITISTVDYINNRDRNIIFDTDEEEVVLACDKNIIEKIILNLISNAIKFSYKDTDIIVKINTRLDLNKVFISIKNYGDAINKDDREKVFANFTQVDDLFIRRTEGCGVGLFLVKKFVEMHDGKIYIDDIDNATQVTFYLPIKVIDEKTDISEAINNSYIYERLHIEFSDIYK